MNLNNLQQNLSTCSRKPFSTNLKLDTIADTRTNDDNPNDDQHHDDK